jgi:hypothetical protein
MSAPTDRGGISSGDLPLPPVQSLEDTEATFWASLVWGIPVGAETFSAPRGEAAGE